MAVKGALAVEAQAAALAAEGREAVDQEVEVREGCKAVLGQEHRGSRDSKPLRPLET